MEPVYEVRTTTATWIEVAVPLPCRSVDVRLTLDKGRQLYFKHLGKLPPSDDVFDVKYEEGQLVVYFEAREQQHVFNSEAAETADKAITLLEALVEDCHYLPTGRCSRHQAMANECPYALARSFLTGRHTNG